MQVAHAPSSVHTQTPARTEGSSAATLRTDAILHGPILPTLLRLAAPNILVVMVQALSSAIDAFYLGRLGPAVLAGIALVFPLWTLMVTSSAGALGGGISSSVARALGAGRHQDANAAVAHSLILASVAGLSFSAVVLIGGPALFHAMGGTGGALDAAVTYSTFVFGGALFVWFVNAFSSLLRGAGEMLFPALVVVGGELFHVAFAPILIFGLSLGVEGAGISLATSYLLRALALGVYVLSRRASVRLPEGGIELRKALFWDILRVGLPSSVSTFVSNFNVMAITSLVGASGVIALAGYGLAARLQFLLIPLVFGFGTAIVTMVGANVGAGQLRRARRVAWMGAGLAGAVTGGVGVVVAFQPNAWLGLFTGDTSVLEFGARYLHIVGPTYALFGLGLALYFAAQGAGRVAPALVAGLVSFTVSVGGGWLVLNPLHMDVMWLFGAIACGLVLFGGIQAFAVNFVIRRSTA